MLKDYKTWELVEELKKREGVEVEMVNVDENSTITVGGPTIVLIVTD